MNYIIDRFDFTLLQFGPLNLLATEVDSRQASAELRNNAFYWFLLDDSTLKSDLAKKGYLCGVFDTIPDVSNPELIGFNSDDKILLIVSTKDSHLTVAATGFRYFLITFEKREIPGPVFIDGKEISSPNVTE